MCTETDTSFGTGTETGTGYEKSKFVQYDLVDFKVKHGPISDVSASQTGDKVSYLLFANDSLAFMRVSDLDCEHFLDVLEAYHRATDQAVNFAKSSIFFNGSVHHDLWEHVKKKLNIVNGMAYNTYLGLPIVVGRKKHALFEFLRDRVENKVANWKGKMLSKAGREVLIKSVIQFAPTFAVRLF
ncbi:uncharacterized protein [Rutidosis leptorrhynchoides]|uniref:uncharacterized protein n=1 Tax=Rutidosis leptorrhynchoides TaxID=125765 RepID=UPI003A99B6FB